MLRHILLISFLTVSVAADTKCTYGGQEMKNNEVITVQNAFKIKCITEDNGSWKTDIVGCVTGQGETVDVGSKHESDEKTFECLKNEQGQVVLKETKGAKAPCQGGHKFGEEWQEKSFKFVCTEGGVTKFTACVGHDGTVIKVGEVGKVGGFDIKCEQHANGTITMQSAKGPTEFECVAKDGSKKKHGETYTEGNFVRKCGDFGSGKIIGCATEGVSDTIPLNKNVTVGDVIHSCTKEGEKYSFKSFSNKAPEVYAMCAHEGKQYKNGSTFITQNAFRMKCVTFSNLTSILDVVSCITPAGIEIPIGTKIEEGDRVYECTSGNITLKSTPGRTGKCRGTYSVGQEWVEQSFKLRCNPYGNVSLTSCITKDGMEIPIGESRRVAEGYSMECVTENGNVVLRAARNAKCVGSDGQQHNFGETWNEGNFVRQCSQFGISSIIACFSENVGRIELNRNATIGSVVHVCINNGEQFSFKTLRKSITFY